MPIYKPTKTSAIRRAKLSNNKKHCYFLELAGETRNHIYEYVYDVDVKVEMMPKDAEHRIKQRPPRKPKPGTSNTPHTSSIEQNSMPTIRCANPLGKYRHLHGINTKWRTSFNALIFSCRQLHREATYYLYARTTFHFESPNRLHNFLTVVPAPHLAAVKRLHLAHVTYGEPRFAVDVVWKEKHDAKWARTCALAVARLPNLESLHVRLDVRDTPLRFELDQAWVAPLLQFSRLRHLRDVSVRLYSRWNHPAPPPRRYLTVHNFLRIVESDRRDEAYVALHRLFAQVLERKIIGWDDASAMEAYVEACWGRYKEYVAAFNVGQHWRW